MANIILQQQGVGDGVERSRQAGEEGSYAGDRKVDEEGGHTRKVFGRGPHLVEDY